MNTKILPFGEEVRILHAATGFDTNPNAVFAFLITPINKM